MLLLVEELNEFPSKQLKSMAIFWNPGPRDVFQFKKLRHIGLTKANLAGRFAASMASDRPTIDAETLLESLLTMKKSSIASKLKPAERNLSQTSWN